MERVVFGLYDESKKMNAGKGALYLYNRGIEVVRYSGLDETLIKELIHPAHHKKHAEGFQEEIDYKLRV